MDDDSLAGASCAPPPFANPAQIEFMLDMFFADEETQPALVKEAKAICVNCPVRERCFDLGMSEEYGVWGGLSAAERVRIFRIAPVVTL